MVVDEQDMVTDLEMSPAGWTVAEDSHDQQSCSGFGKSGAQAGEIIDGRLVALGRLFDVESAVLPVQGAGEPVKNLDPDSASIGTLPVAAAGFAHEVRDAGCAQANRMNTLDRGTRSLFVGAFHEDSAIVADKGLGEVMLGYEPTIEANADLPHNCGIENEISRGLIDPGLYDRQFWVGLEIELLSGD